MDASLENLRALAVAEAVRAALAGTD